MMLPISCLDVPCRHHCQHGEYTWKLSVTLCQFAQLAQSPAAFYPFGRVRCNKVNCNPHSFPTSAMHLLPEHPESSSCNSHLVFLGQLPPGILILGQFTLPIRGRKGRGGCEHVGQDTREDLTTFPCLQSQQLKMPVVFSTSRADISPHNQFLNNSTKTLEP